MGWWAEVRSGVPLAAMITVECTDVGLATISKAAMTNGMSNFVFVVYYNALGTLLLLPYIFSRKNGIPLNFSLLTSFFLLGLIGSLAQILGYTGLNYSSPTLTLTMTNLIPIFTFILAVIFRMEKLDISGSGGRAVALGAVVSVSGAFIITLYKGPQILMSSSSSSSHSEFIYHFLHSQQSNWVLGGIFMAVTCLLTAIWNVFMAATVKDFPDNITTVFFYCFFSSILSAIFSLVVERNPNAWKLRPDMGMIAILCTAIFGVVLRSGVHIWCLKEKGPVFVSMFKPLGMAIAVVIGTTFLGDTLYIGRVMGSGIIVLGFYAVMWGKAKEQSASVDKGINDLESCSHKTPFLLNNSKEEIQRSF